MALTFGAATSDRVTHGSAAVLDNLDPYTWLVWIRPTTLTNNRIIVGKSTSPGTGKMLAVNGTGGNVQVLVNRATDLSYTTSDTPMSLNTWGFIAATFNSANAAGEIVNIYGGTETVIAVERALATTTNGTAPNDDESTTNLTVGNFDGGTSTFQGQIAWVGVWNIEMTLAQIQAQQYFPHVTSGCVFFARYNNSTVGTQYDFSGFQNNGTVTGATVATITEPANVVFFDSAPLPNNYQSVEVGSGMSCTESIT